MHTCSANRNEHLCGGFVMVQYESNQVCRIYSLTWHNAGCLFHKKKKETCIHWNHWMLRKAGIMLIFQLFTLWRCGQTGYFFLHVNKEATKAILYSLRKGKFVYTLVSTQQRFFIRHQFVEACDFTFSSS